MCCYEVAGEICVVDDQYWSVKDTEYVLNICYKSMYKM